MRPSLSSLLDQARSLPLARQRKVSCLLGAAVADAAARPLHWVYDLSVLNRAVSADPSRPEFLPQSHSPYYSLPTGDNSCYWDEALAVLKVVAAAGPGWSHADVAAQFHRDFGPDSPYDMRRREEYMRRRNREGRLQEPLDGKWLHGGMIGFLRDGVGGPGIKETDGFCCSLPAVVAGAGQDGLRERVVRLAETQSRWPVALRHAQVRDAKNLQNHQILI